MVAEDEVADASADAEPSWLVVARKRQLRQQLDDEIARDQHQAILDSRAAGVPATALAEMWGVTPAWIYTVAPARSTSKKGRSGLDRTDT